MIYSDAKFGFRYPEERKDLNYQVGCIITTVVLAPFTLLFSFFLLGFFHAASTLYWLFEEPRYVALKARKIIEVINLIVLIVWLLSPLFNNGFWTITIAMLFVGPVLGASYFIITKAEIKHYKKLLKTFTEEHSLNEQP